MSYDSFQAQWPEAQRVQPWEVQGLLQEVALRYSPPLTNLTVGRRVVWMLSSLTWQLEGELPWPGAVYQMETWTRQASASRLSRSYRLQSESGCLLSEAIYILVDYESRQVQRLRNFCSLSDSEHVGELEQLVWPLRPELSPVLQLHVSYNVEEADLDDNGHMNNCRYLLKACEALQAQWQDLNFSFPFYQKTSFKHELLLGDKIDLHLAFSQNMPASGRTFIDLKATRGMEQQVVYTMQLEVENTNEA